MYSVALALLVGHHSVLAREMSAISGAGPAGSPPSRGRRGSRQRGTDPLGCLLRMCMGVDPEDVYDTQSALRAADLKGASAVSIGPRVDDYRFRRVGGCIPGAVGEELVDVGGADAVAVVALVLGVDRQ